MSLVLTVFLSVLGATAVVGLAGYAVDRNTARHEHKSARSAKE